MSVRLVAFRSLLIVVTLLLLPLLARPASTAGVVLGAAMAPAPGPPGPSFLSYQGLLLDPTTGNAKPDGDYAMVFSLYNVEAGGTALWFEARSIAVSGGRFSTLLGDQVALPDSIFDGQALWLGIRVGASDPEATPRQRLAYTAYAMFSKNSDLLDGYHADTLVNLKYINLPLYSAFLEGGAHYGSGFGAHAGMYLPDAGTPSFSYGFGLPPDYTTGTPILMHFTWHTSGTGCNLYLGPNYLSVAREGQTHILGPNADSGMTVVGSPWLAAPATQEASGGLDLQLTTPSPGTPLHAGDVLSFGMFRSAAADSCTTDLVIQGVQVTYQ